MSHLCLALILAVAGAGDGVEAAKANNAFAVDLYKQLSVGEGNLFFSPLSLATALAMTHAGANGATADEMAKVLHLGAVADAEFGTLVKGMKVEESSPPYDLSVANALWLQKGQPPLESFLKTTQEQFGAGLFTVDFEGAAETARKEINGWTEKQTAGKIRDLIVPGILSVDTRLVLTNAIYFKGKWEHPFKKRHTHGDTFHVSSEKKVPVRMMRQNITVPYAKGNGFQVVSLPYKGSNLAMLVVLPDAVDGLKTVEAGLTVERLGEWAAVGSQAALDLSLPQFKSSSEFGVKRQLSAMGMSKAFGPEADFSRMSNTEGLFVSSVQHKACVDVDEKGAEAAAATGWTVASSASIAPIQRIVFKVDHPFLYAIYDKTSGAVLFLGRMVDPPAGS